MYWQPLWGVFGVVIVNKPVLRNSKFFQLCFLGLSLLLIGQTSARAEFYDPYGLNLSGSIGYTYSFNKTNNRESEVNLIRVNVAGNSAIWRPWFATMSAGLGFGLATSESTSSNAPESNFTSNTVNLAFAVFPLSRFPFRLTYALSRNESESISNAEEGLLSTTLITKTRRIGISQAYTTYDRTHINFFYNRSDFESLFSNFLSSIAGLRVNRSWAKQRYSIDSSYIDTEQQDVGNNSTSLSLTATHGYLPSAEMGITSLFSHSTSKSESVGGSGSESSVNQVSTSASWRPEHKPYSVSGGARFSKTTTDNSVRDSVETSAVGIGLTMSYIFSRQIRGNLTINANSSESEGRQSLNSSEIGTIGFFSSPTTIFDFFYNWNLSGSVSNANSKLDGNPAAVPPVEDTKTSSQSASVSIGHAASRSWLFDSGNLNFGFSENLAVSKRFPDDNDSTLSTEDTETDELTKAHSISFNTSVNHLGWGGNTIFNVAVSDSRTLEEDGVVFQLASLSLARNQGINRLSSASGNFNYQASKTDNPLTIEPGASDTEESASIRFAYRHSRLFGVFALTYASTLRQERLLADGDSQRGNLTWVNSFSYAIGLLSTKLNIRITEAPEGERTLGVNFSATRSF